jgi:phosphoglycerate dehydrogenase-like enzyme
MIHQPRIAIVLDSWESESFLPPPVMEALHEISGSLFLAQPSEFRDKSEWEEWLSRSAPEILISGWTTPELPLDTLARVPSLKYVCHLVGAIRGTIPERLIEEGLLVTNWGHSISRTVAECGLMLAIAALRRVSWWTLEMHERGGWKDRKAVETGSLFGRRVGLHGFGAIAQELRKLLEPFGVPVSTYSPSVPDALLEAYAVERAVSLEALFSENDVIIELAALTSRTRGVVTEALLRMIPRGGVFVNVGRGAVVDEEALARVAAEGHIQVALDVFAVEPLPLDSPLRRIDHVLMLPHLGGPTIDRRQDAAWHGLENIRRYLSGEPLQSRINVEISNRIS